MPEKLSEDHACVGCGYCCIKNTCTYGLYRHPDAQYRKCPELEWTGQRYVCRMMNLSGSMGGFYRELLQAGRGCRSYLNPWRKDIRERHGNE